VADHSNKIQKDDIIVDIFGESLHNFLYYEDEVKPNPGDDLLKAGILVLTMERITKNADEYEIIASWWSPDFGSALLNSPKSHHDLVLVGSDREETKVHKFALAGQFFFFAHIIPRSVCFALFSYFFFN
jgi:hypothetical protein